MRKRAGRPRPWARRRRSSRAPGAATRRCPLHNVPGPSSSQRGFGKRAVKGDLLTLSDLAISCMLRSEPSCRFPHSSARMSALLCAPAGYTSPPRFPRKAGAAAGGAGMRVRA
jgi:hypothetical protein